MKFILNMVLYPVKILKTKKFIKFLNALPLSRIDALNGHEFEMILYELFKALGYNAKLTKISYDKGADIIIKKRKNTAVIQTKLYFGHSVGIRAVQEIYAAQHYFNANAAIIITNSVYSKSACELSEKLNVALIDRNILQQIISGSLKENKQLINKIITENITRGKYAKRNS